MFPRKGFINSHDRYGNVLISTRLQKEFIKEKIDKFYTNNYSFAVNLGLTITVQTTKLEMKIYLH